MFLNPEMRAINTEVSVSESSKNEDAAVAAILYDHGVWMTR